MKTITLDKLYFSHTLISTTCPICSATHHDYIFKCNCGFYKYHTGFNLFHNNKLYYFNIFNITRSELDLPLNTLTSYKQLLNHIAKLEVFK